MKLYLIEYFDTEINKVSGQIPQDHYESEA